jgi:hypothetical protein
MVMGWQSAELMWNYMVPSVRASSILSIPLSPFLFIIALGSVILALELLVHVFQPPPDGKGKV